MMMQDLAATYRTELLESIVPFWETHCPDKEYGAYFTCLDRDGTVYDTEKYMWMQWRIVWMFSELYTTIEPRQQWLDLAMLGYDFLVRHGKDEQGRYYFSLARNGTPATAPYSVYSDCFAAMGCAALYRITGDDAIAAEARSAYDQYLRRCDSPKGEWEKGLPGRGQYRSLGYYMMQANLAMVLGDCLGDETLRADVRKPMDTVLRDFWSPEHGVVFENIKQDGGFDLDSMTGRQLNPGHALEAMWFLMNAAVTLGERERLDAIGKIILSTLEFGWDPDHGGIFYFMDVLHRPHVELQWDMKLWWVHCEALIATARAAQWIGGQEFQDWFERIHAWTWRHFPDPEHGEWFGYLNRRGELTHTLKGGKWKTFFHLPRMLLECSQSLGNDQRGIPA